MAQSITDLSSVLEVPEGEGSKHITMSDGPQLQQCRTLAQYPRLVNTQISRVATAVTWNDQVLAFCYRAFMTDGQCYILANLIGLMFMIN